ncbi:MAG: hypothetical protein HN685_03950, partial [Waddliaceae bacterium]|nr:hypothetical protein [Waddliaceae bacterium]
MKPLSINLFKNLRAEPAKPLEHVPGYITIAEASDGKKTELCVDFLKAGHKLTETKGKREWQPVAENIKEMLLKRGIIDKEGNYIGENTSITKKKITHTVEKSTAEIKGEYTFKHWQLKKFVRKEGGKAFARNKNSTVKTCSALDSSTSNIYRKFSKACSKPVPSPASKRTPPLGDDRVNKSDPKGSSKTAEAAKDAFQPDPPPERRPPAAPEFEKSVKELQGKVETACDKSECTDSELDGLLTTINELIEEIAKSKKKNKASGVEADVDGDFNVTDLRDMALDITVKQHEIARGKYHVDIKRDEISSNVRTDVLVRSAPISFGEEKEEKEKKPIGTVQKFHSKIQSLVEGQVLDYALTSTVLRLCEQSTFSIGLDRMPDGMPISNIDERKTIKITRSGDKLLLEFAVNGDILNTQGMALYDDEKDEGVKLYDITRAATISVGVKPDTKEIEVFYEKQPAGTPKKVIEHIMKQEKADEKDRVFSEATEQWQKIKSSHKIQDKYTMKGGFLKYLEHVRGQARGKGGDVERAVNDAL